ncbi:stage II sporulation protein P [Metabacillus crassostreae]|uniref:stage II sporulation protein P n=1 Tax=Metabacillus crassostreae TaxID=929098 RepID=UPI00195A4EB5|nr:stage II sporulation protein P [Metabacillus crassostreae]MBM7602630.1 stage II sporulation protein P [Metabacillus crassostreae]
MLNEKEIFDSIKNSQDLKPRKEFVHQTKLNLIIEAKKYNKRQKKLKLSYYFSGVVAAVLLVTWITFLGGTQYIAESVSKVKASFTFKISTPDNNKDKTPISNGNAEVFIYHTHNTESFTPLLNIDDPIKSAHNEKNVTLVGEKLANSLKKREVNALHDKTDIQQILKDKGLSYSYSYEVAKDIIIKALDENSKMKLLIDIHREGRTKEYTTTKINGKDVAKIEFVVSKHSSKFKENLEISEKIQLELETEYPGITSGVKVNGKESIEQDYNQDLFANSLLVNIGGAENSLEEIYRSVEIFSKVIEEVLDEID